MQDACIPNLNKRDANLLKRNTSVNLGGIIKDFKTFSLNISTKTIVIKIKKTNEDKTFILSDDVKIGNDVKSLNELIINEYIGFSYESLDGKDFVLDIYPQRQK